MGTCITRPGCIMFSPHAYVQTIETLAAHVLMWEVAHTVHAQLLQLTQNIYIRPGKSRLLLCNIINAFINHFHYSFSVSFFCQSIWSFLLIYIHVLSFIYRLIQSFSLSIISFMAFINHDYSCLSSIIYKSLWSFLLI